jgi:hypothetical protein
VANHRSRPFRRQPLAPIFSRESPANFDAGCKCRLERRHQQPHEADELAIFAQLSGAQSEPVPLETVLDLVNPTVTLLS